MVFRLIIATLLFVVAGGAIASSVESYEVSYGDYNYDGYRDLYIAPKPRVVILHADVSIPITLPSDVSHFVLQQRADQNFDIVTTINTSDQSRLDQWPIASIEVTSVDVNIDGNLDLIIQGVESIIFGAFNQIVYAAAEPNAAPASVTAIDERVKQFVEEGFGWLKNPNYLVDKLILNDWWHVDVVRSNITGWWSLTYLWNWNFSFSGNFVQDTMTEADATNPYARPGLCGLVYCIWSSGRWWAYVTVDELEFVWETEHLDQTILTFAIINQDGFTNAPYPTEVSDLDADALEDGVEAIIGSQIGYSERIFYRLTLQEALPEEFPRVTTPRKLPSLDEKLPTISPVKIVVLSRVITILGAVLHAENAGTQDELEELAIWVFAQDISYDQAQEHKEDGGNRRAVIGEYQPRVVDAALRYGAIEAGSVWPDELQPRSDNAVLTRRAQLFNKGWINGIIIAQFDIFDIGRWINRAGQPVSPLYQLERRQIAVHNYQRYRQIDQPDTLNFEYED